MSGPGRWSHTHALLWLGPFHCPRTSVLCCLQLLLQLLPKWGSDWLLHGLEPQIKRDSRPTGVFQQYKHVIVNPTPHGTTTVQVTFTSSEIECGNCSILSIVSLPMRPLYLWVPLFSYHCWRFIQKRGLWAWLRSCSTHSCVLNCSKFAQCTFVWF